MLLTSYYPMMKARLVIATLIVLLSSLSFCQYTVPGGNVSQSSIDISAPAGSWDGIYGEVVLGSGLNYSYTVFGGNITRINMVAEVPPCNISTISMHVIAVNSTSLTAPLSPGNLSILDRFIDSKENGSLSFTSLGSFNLTYGQITGVPILFTYAANVSSPYFREGYMNDALGNLVFVADVVDNRPDWNGSTSDYQMILPTNGTPTGYTLWVDVNYTCLPPFTPPNPPGGGDTHELYIDPVGVIEVIAGQSIDPEFLVINTGDFPEDDIAVTLSCPASFSCGAGSIPHLGIGHQQGISLPITVDGPGEYLLTVCARSAHARYCRDFLVQVSPECSVDDECGSGGYCEAQECEPKKKPGEKCDRAPQCENGACSGGICVYCTSDDDCPDSQMCSGGSCIPVPCPCGIVKSHACERYSCCSDSECGKCRICTGNSCSGMESDILLVSGELLEGEYVRVQVVDSRGIGVSGARVFTDDMSAYTDANGFASIKLPYTGIIYASADCYPQAGIMLDITHNAYFIIPDPVYEDEEEGFQLVDSKGRPVPGATVFIEGDSIVTDSQGRFSHTFQNPGQVRTKGQKIGYKVNDVDIDVLSRSMACSYPAVVGLLSFSSYNMHVLWMISIAMAVLNLILIDRRARPFHMIRKAVYSFGPLIFALPTVGIFTICLVSNIVLLQLLIELAVFLRGLLLSREPAGQDARAGEQQQGRYRYRGE